MEIVYVTLVCYFLFILRIVLSYLKIRNKGLLANKKPSAKTIISTTFLSAFFIVFTSELIIQLANPSILILPAFLVHKVPISPVLSVLGIFLLILSVITLFITLSTFGEAMRFGLDSNRLGKFISHGIFMHSRNPFFVSILIHLIGIALVVSNVFFILVAISTILAIHFFILKEEQFMRANYGEEYEQYCNTVRRYF